MRKCVYSSSNDGYALKCLVALSIFCKKNSGFDAALLGTSFSDKHKAFAKQHNIRLIEKDLSNVFFQSWDPYPVECFYVFAGPLLLDDYDALVYIDGDIYCNKSLNYNFESREFQRCTIASAFPRRILLAFPSLKRDAEKINDVWTQCHWTRKGPHSGVLFFNVENCKKRNFFGEICSLYKLSIENNIPRKGDDSLLCLWYLLTSDKRNCAVLPATYNCIVAPPKGCSYNDFKIELIHDAVLFHCIRLKPWHDVRTHPNGAYVSKYFATQWQKDACEYLSPEQLIKMFPNFSKLPVKDDDILAYWYDKAKNVGDFFTPYFIEKFCGKKRKPREPKPSDGAMTIVSTGSIYRLVNERAVVFGSGIRDRDQDIKKSHMVCSVRGPLTRKRVLEIGDECPTIYGDPALLLSRLYKPKTVPTPQTAKQIAIIPHVSQYAKVNAIYGNSKDFAVIDLRTVDVESIVETLCKYKMAVSSSLHGIIICHAYKISVRWIKFDDNIKGDDTKFYDHFQAVGLKNETFIDALGYKLLKRDELAKEISAKDIEIDLELLQNSMFFDERGFKKWLGYVLAGNYLI